MANGDNQPTNIVDQRQLLQAMIARMAAQGNQPGSPTSLSGIPGAASSPVNTPQATPAPTSQSQTQAPPQGAARQLSPASPTPFNSTFGDRRGIISSIVDSAEKRGHDKKVNEAEMYYNQINSFLASGQPGDQAKAQQMLDDPKIRKILKTGLDYVPLEEDVPPEAIGIHQAQQKINQKQSVIGQIKQMLSGGRQQGNAQPRPQGRAVIPQASQASQQAFQLGEAKTAEQQALAEAHSHEAGLYDAQALAEKQKADAETVKAAAEKAHWESESNKTTAELELARKKLKDMEDPTSQEYRAAEAKINVSKAQKFELDNHAKYYDKMGNKLPGSVLDKGLNSTRADLMVGYKNAIADNNNLKKISDKNVLSDTFHPNLKARLVSSAALVKKYNDAFKWWDSTATEDIKASKMTLGEASTKFYNMVGISPLASGVGDGGATTNITIDTPDGLMQFPDQASADAFKQEAGIQ